jgi:hypothetical protein
LPYSPDKSCRGKKALKKAQIQIKAFFKKTTFIFLEEQTEALLFV